jgi:imidazolonepropionase-like amidohydrolase
MYRSMRNMWGTNAIELELMASFGMPAGAAIAAATGNAARALGMQDDLGTVEVGRLADLVCVDGDPTSDVRILQDTDRIAYVLQAGRIVAGARTRPILPSLGTADHRAAPDLKAS